MLNICIDIAYDRLDKNEQDLLEGIPSNIPLYIIDCLSLGVSFDIISGISFPDGHRWQTGYALYPFQSERTDDAGYQLGSPCGFSLDTRPPGKLG